MNRNRQGRNIIKRIIVRGVLVLDTPTCLSNGDAESLTSMMLLRDSISDRALLTGSSIAGALRNYLHNYQCNYGTSESRQNMAAQLFGDLFSYQDEKDEKAIKIKNVGDQSPLIVHDALSNSTPMIELRDGVKLDVSTGVATNQAKYDLELLSAGTEFQLQFELLVEENEDKNKNILKESLALVLEGLKNGEINIGMKKHRGFGRCHVDKWDVWEFDLRKQSDRINWLTFGRSWIGNNPAKPHDGFPNNILKKLSTNIPDKRNYFEITAEFKLASPLIIRSGQDLNPGKLSPDVVHLHSYRTDKKHQSKSEVSHGMSQSKVASSSDKKDGFRSVVSGTSLAGALRHRAEKIVKTLHKDLQIVNHLFGFVREKEKTSQSSRLLIKETTLENIDKIVQTRITVDRFTGGAYHGALFQEEPIFQIKDLEDDQKNKQTKHRNTENSHFVNLKLELKLHNPKNHEIGLILLLLKDLWNKDLPIGGSKSIGRGRLKGLAATIVLHNSPTSVLKWEIKQVKDGLNFAGTDKKLLEGYLQELLDYTL